MKTFSRLVGAAAVVVVLGGSTPALAVGEGERTKGAFDSAQGKSSSRQAPGGSIVSVVRDKSGRPIPSAIVSAIGRALR